jgi:DNA-binding NarL/FixJ family response regulator
MKKKIRVLLADDQALFAESLKSVLELKYADIEVVGIAQDGSEAVEYAYNKSPDVILMDIRMPIIDGVEATRMIHEKHPESRIIILTTFDDDEYVQEALSFGAVGYVLKNIPVRDLADSIRLVHGGAFLVSSAIAPKIVRKFTLAAAPANHDPFIPDWFSRLTRREKDILFLIASGLDNKEIANRLNMAVQTTRNYVASIYVKLGVHDRSHAMKLIIDAKIGQSNSFPKTEYEQNTDQPINSC